MTSGDQISSALAINSSRQIHFPMDVELTSTSPSAIARDMSLGSSREAPSPRRG